jgi:uncharacterized protein YndB with AHSA1/START domain
VPGEKKGEVLLEGDHVTIVFRRLIRHSIDKVWRAITDPRELCAWMLASAAIDPRPGGRIEYVASPDPLVWYGTIRVWDPPRVYEHELDTDADPRWAEHLGAERTIARWQLDPQGDATLLTLTFRGFTRSTAGGFAPGTHAFLDRLEAHLAGEPLPDWTRRFEEVKPLYDRE